MPTDACEVWGVTPDLWTPEQTTNAILAVLNAGVDRVIVRERRLTVQSRHAIVQGVLAHGVAPHRVLLRLGSDDPAPPAGWSVHLADGVPRPSNDPSFVSATVHSTSRLRSDVDVLVAAPFASPRSKHSTTTPLGTGGLHRIVAASSRPVLALGGITNTNASQAVAAGAVGVAAISAVFLDGEPSLGVLLERVRAPR